jgi:hypothetical protein
VGPGEFPGSKEHPLRSTLIEKRKEIDFSGCRQTWFARLLVSRLNKQKEEVHGNEFDRNFQRCGGNKLFAGSSNRFGCALLPRRPSTTRRRRSTTSPQAGGPTDTCRIPFVWRLRAYAPGFHDLIFGLLRDAGIVPNISQTAAEIATLISLVDAHMGVAILPALAVKHSAASVIACDIVDRIPMSEIAIVFSKRARAAVLDNFRTFALKKLGRHYGKNL